MIKANVVALTRMCSMLMPGMVERGKGVVINISSLSSTMPAEMLSVYAASKVSIVTSIKYYMLKYLYIGFTVYTINMTVYCNIYCLFMFSHFY